MLFNLEKCAIMHFGFNKIGESMELGGKLLVSHTSERDLGVIVQSYLKVDMQCNKAACEANRRLGMIREILDYSLIKSVMLPLYKSIVRPHLDYCVQAWSDGDLIIGRILMSWKRCRGETRLKRRAAPRAPSRAN